MRSFMTININSSMNENVIYKYLYNKLYYRGTNNKKEPDLIISGKMRASVNHKSNRKEQGLSVADVFNDKSGVAVSSTFEQLLKYFKYVYIVSGEEIGIGSDGEPLLDVSSLEFINWIKCTSR